MTWRIGRTYGIHVYEGDRPVATFSTVLDAQRAVEAVNASCTCVIENDMAITGSAVMSCPKHGEARLLELADEVMERVGDIDEGPLIAACNAYVDARAALRMRDEVVAVPDEGSSEPGSR